MTRRLEYVSLDEVKPAPRNPKLHDEATLDASMERFGFTEPVLLDERTGRLVAGHGRIERLRARRAAGDPAPEGVQVTKTGVWKLPVVRGWSSADDAEAEAYLVASNRLVETGGWNRPELVDMLSALTDGPSLDGIGYDLESLSDLIDSLPPLGDDEQGEPGGSDEVPDQIPHISKPGDVWLLGPHRVACGDSGASSEAFDAVLEGSQADMIWTDPPYGVDYVGKTDEALTIENDALPHDQLVGLLRAALGFSVAAARPGAVVVVAAPAGPQLLAFAQVLADLKVWRQGLVWVKDRFVLGHSDYHYRHEILFYGWVPGASHRATRDRTQDSVWEFPRPDASREHPTMKPVGLVERSIKEHTIRGELVLDPFGGSGTTLMAAEACGRRAAIIEKDPRYVDVICARFQRETGVLPRQCGGTEVDFLT